MRSGDVSIMYAASNAVATTTPYHLHQVDLLRHIPVIEKK
jgi:hypothetical protein